MKKENEVVPECKADALGNQDTNRFEKVKTIAGRHGLEIVLGVGCIVLSAINIRQGNIISLKDRFIALQGARIDELLDLCDEKDAWFKELMSDALRHGSSFAGKCMVDRRETLSGR